MVPINEFGSEEQKREWLPRIQSGDIEFALGYSEAEGNTFALVNLEARAPLIAAILPGPIPLFPLYNIQAVGFVDAGLIAQGLDAFKAACAGAAPTDAASKPARYRASTRTSASTVRFGCWPMACAS